MGYIKEPKGIDLVVGPSELTEQDTNCIRLAISAYKNKKTAGKFSSIKEEQSMVKESLQSSYVSLPQTLAIKAKDGRIHMLKVTGPSKSRVKSVLYAGKKETNKK